MNESFVGFPKKCQQFFAELENNNNKTWFDSHKDDFEKYVMDPARALVVAIGDGLNTLTRNISAIPKVNQSIFGINRDVRFGTDKSPYKTHVAMIFWEGDGPKMERSGFYLQIDKSKYGLGGGMHLFTKPQLEEFRKSVVSPKHGAELAKIVKKLRAGNSKAIDGKKYKKIPSGYDANHENSEFLLHDGLFLMWETPFTKIESPEKFIKEILDKYKEMIPLHEWCVEVTNRAK